MVELNYIINYIPIIYIRTRRLNKIITYKNIVPNYFISTPIPNNAQIIPLLL